jgi:hypothetical protein
MKIAVVRINIYMKLTAKRKSRQDFPTPESPIIISLIVSSL